MPDPSFQPDWFSKPGDTLLTLMEQRELTLETVSARLGCKHSVVQGLLAGTVAVDDSLATKLSEHIGGTSDFWKSRQAKYVAALSRAADAVPKQLGVDWLNKFPHADIARHGWVEHPDKRDQLVKSYLAFFGVNTPNEWSERYASFLKGTSFRTSPTFKSKVGAISAWLRQGEIEAAALHSGPWNPKKLRGKLEELRVLTKAKAPSYFLPRLRKICSECGVAVVFGRTPKGCTASGATRFISADKAMVILSFRYLTDDHFWFTFFHELGHLLLHKMSMTFVDGEPGINSTMEAQANNFAATVLVPTDRLDELKNLPPRREPIIRFAFSIGVSAGIVVGQLQHYRIIKPNQMNFLKRRFDWPQLSAAMD